MNRLTETKMERDIRVGFAYIDHIFDKAIAELDELKKDYEPKPIAKSESCLNMLYDQLRAASRQDLTNWQLQGIAYSQLCYPRWGQVGIRF